MIFRQLFDSVSSTYTYLQLVKVVDTHVHADHVTAMGALRDKTSCVTVMGEQSPVDVVSMRVSDGERVTIEGLSMTAMHTPGHTDDSYCFRMDDRVFTGDTLLIRGTGRTDFQNGDAGQQYDSLFDGVLKLPESTLVYPAHDYKGDTVSTIGEEKSSNPRLQVAGRAEYIELMANLKLANPKMMDVAVPENMRMGLNIDRQCEVATIAPERIIADNAEGMVIVDLREEGERVKSGVIPGSVHAPYSRLDQHLDMLRQAEGRDVVFYCAVGERSTMAVNIARDRGVSGCAHIPGGFIAWAEAGGNIDRV